MFIDETHPKILILIIRAKDIAIIIHIHIYIFSKYAEIA